MNQEGHSLKFEDISDVPDVLLGGTLYYKIEMFVVGFRREMQASIAYTKLGAELFTINILASCSYKDNEDYGDICHYNEQVGNN
jgi:hypothetical protein